MLLLSMKNNNLLYWDTNIQCLGSYVSALEVIFYNEMHYINLRFTYLLTYLLYKRTIINTGGTSWAKPPIEKQVQKYSGSGK